MTLFLISGLSYLEGKVEDNVSDLHFFPNFLY